MCKQTFCSELIKLKGHPNSGYSQTLQEIEFDLIFKVALRTMCAKNHNGSTRTIIIRQEIKACFSQHLKEKVNCTEMV
jgi:hypothetical protein